MTWQPHDPNRTPDATVSADTSATEYRLIDIVPAQPPDGGSGEWFEYRIAQGRNTIRGYKSGSRFSVTTDVEQIVEVLNERRMVRRGRVQLVPSSKP
jgi:hypothetical protein